MSAPDTPDPIREARERAQAAFERPGPLPPAARTEEAEAQLLAALERELGVTLEEPARSPAPDPAGGGLRGFFARMVAAPAWRPALAVALVLVVVAGAWSRFGPGKTSGDDPLLRGSDVPPPSGGSVAWNAGAAAARAGSDRVRLTWNPAPGATAYAVVFLAADLSEIARVDDVAATELVLDKNALPAGLAPSSDVLWRVTAYASGDEIARSTASPVTLP